MRSTSSLLDAVVVTPWEYELVTLHRAIREVHDRLRATTDKATVDAMCLEIKEAEEALMAVSTLAGQRMNQLAQET